MQLRAKCYWGIRRLGCGWFERAGDFVDNLRFLTDLGEGGLRGQCHCTIVSVFGAIEVGLGRANSFVLN